MSYDHAQTLSYGDKEKSTLTRSDSEEKDVIVAAPPQENYGIEPIEALRAKDELEVTRDDLVAVEDNLDSMSLERCYAIMKQVKKLHEHDQNFPGSALERITEFLNNPDVLANPNKHYDLITEMKLEALLVTENSPYGEVRANVENTDDPTLPSLTLRVWVIGVLFSGVGAFINELFAIRNPSVYVTANVAQLLAYPLGKLFAAALPDKRFRLFGKEHSLNPGPFNRKEHMLITIMATVAYNTPYTQYVVFVQALPQYFNEPYARNFSYQILNSLGSNFVGLGLAGLCRQFLVFPSFCVWPTSLVTVALNKAFHTTTNEPVAGPFNRIYTWSRERFFLITFAAMFVYWWFPGFIFTALSYFNWLPWIAPDNTNLNNLTGAINGLGLNPWPTFDFNMLTVQGWVPLTIPAFTILNQLVGMTVAGAMIIAFYYSNAFHTGYLPINSNKIYANTGARYKVSKILTNGKLDHAKYEAYSEPWMAAGNLVNYFWFFAIYTATISYAFLYHYHDIKLGFQGLWRKIQKMRKREVDEAEEDLGEDIHYRLMKIYPEVPEWWYLSIMVVAAGLGMAGIGAFPTNSTPAAVIYGIIMALISIIPVGMIYAVTGIQVTMNVLAEFIGGAMANGNAIEMNFFKMYGYITTAQALYFCGDLKLAHYAKIPPRHTFICQMVAVLISTFVCVAIFNFQINFKNVCTADAAFNFTCPGQNTFFTASVFWGTLGAKKLFGKGAHYNSLLLGFPVGFLLPIVIRLAQKSFPRQKWLRQLHPVMICAGGLLWAPYNFANYLPAVYITVLSWLYVKKRYFAFWSKYNYVLAASWMSAIALAAIVIFFALEVPNVELNWWGNTVNSNGCEGTACRRLEIPDVGYFGPAPNTGSYH